jgi:hypothetical protein
MVRAGWRSTTRPARSSMPQNGPLNSARRARPVDMWTAQRRPHPHRPISSRSGHLMCYQTRTF